MNQRLSAILYIAIFAAPSMAQIPAGSIVSFALEVNPEMCLGAVAPLEDAPIVLGTCGTLGTAFTLDNTVPALVTRLQLRDSAEPLCVNADPSHNVLLEVCADAPLERWNVTVGTTQIKSSEALCITAPVDGKRGDLVTTQNCTAGVQTQLWTTNVVSEA